MSDQDTQVIAPVDPARAPAPTAASATAATADTSGATATSEPARDELDAKPSGRLSSLKAPKLALKLGAPAGVWAGLAIAAIGFGTIFYSWIKVAATLDVGRQMPYVVSGAMTGLGLIVIGIAVVDMAVRRQDRMERRQQLATMRHVLEELRAVMDKDRTPGT